MIVKSSVWDFDEPDLLILDNRDSFVYNLAHRLYEVGLKSVVIRSDKIDLEALIALEPKAIVISPGPGHPKDAGCSVDALRYFDGKIPLLGICLGHQAIAYAFGAKVRANQKPRHGKTSFITRSEDPIFEGVEDLEVGRYHSLVVEEQLPENLIELSRSEDDDFLMALRSRNSPTWGLQFHPESVLTKDGLKILHNFSRVVRESSFSEKNE